MKHKKFLAVIAAVLALTTLLTACGNNASTDTGETVSGSEAGKYRWKITIPGKTGSLCNSPTYIAYEKGFFAEEGIDAELISADFETKKVGLNNGTIATINGDFQYFPSIEGDIQMTVIEGLHMGCIKLNVLGDSDIQTAEDLRGKKIAVDEIGGTTYQVALLWMGQAGVSVDEVTFLPFSDGNLEVQALLQKQVDVAALWDPLATTTVGTYGLRTILDIGKDEPFAGHYCCFLYASTKVIEEDPELIAAELRAYHKAQAWIAENPEEAVDLVTSKQYVSIEDYDVAVELINCYEYPTQSGHSHGGADVKADVEYFAKALYDIGYLTTDPAEFAAKAYTYVDPDLGKN